MIQQAMEAMPTFIVLKCSAFTEYFKDTSSVKSLRNEVECTNVSLVSLPR